MYVKRITIRQGFDFCNHHQEEMLSRLIVDRLEVNGGSVVQALGGNIDRFEGYRF
ncbi:hypothetical protein SAMN05444266_101144 [Chitinophaga jiangningensis]|uniref:Uncharacterized protein n=1 Tax=Chitinophaga jiangningensis TaxID=1419482 RepID=A0A1M6VBD8_9BACT|nr:hypothetical protein SAMN05444266_101144 [Chitinophaga jiangningensis]